MKNLYAYDLMTETQINAAQTRSMGFGKPLLLDFVRLYDQQLNEAVCSLQVSDIEKAFFREVQMYIAKQTQKDNGAKCLQNLPTLIHEAALKRVKELRQTEAYFVYFVKCHEHFSKDIHYEGMLYASNINHQEPARVFKKPFGKFKDKNEVDKFVKTSSLLNHGIGKNKPFIIYGIEVEGLRQIDYKMKTFVKDNRSRLPLKY